MTHDTSLALQDATALHLRRRARNARIGAGLRYLLLSVVGLVMLYPLIWLVGAYYLPINREVDMQVIGADLPVHSAIAV